MLYQRAKLTRAYPASAWRRPVTAILLGFALIAVALAGGPVPGQNDFGSGTAWNLAQPVATPSGAAQGRARGTQIPIDSGVPQPVQPPVVPVDVVIESIDVDAKVIPVGIDPATRMMEVPPDVATLGWYRNSAALDSSAGPIVIVGHVDGYGQGQGALFHLRNVPASATIVATGTDGRTRTYQVVARESFLKRSLPLDRIFSRQGTARLTLITCGGPFDQRTRSYRDNIVVTAVPIREPRTHRR